jgi:hypothetical protein
MPGNSLPTFKAFKALETPRQDKVDTDESITLRVNVLSEFLENMTVFIIPVETSSQRSARLFVLITETP